MHAKIHISFQFQNTVTFVLFSSPFLPFLIKGQQSGFPIIDLGTDRGRLLSTHKKHVSVCIIIYAHLTSKTLFNNPVHFSSLFLSLLLKLGGPRGLERDDCVVKHER